MNNDHQLAIKWVKEYLHINGYEVLDESQMIRGMSWSKVI